jgi:subtilisin family serine protease
MRKNTLLFVLLTAFTLSAQPDSLMFRIRLTDKLATRHSLEHPQAYLCEKALARRQKQNLPVDSTDLPVCRAYLDSIRATGVRIVATGKWENFVTVACNDTALIARIAQFPFVRSTQPVWRRPRGAEEPSPTRESIYNSMRRLPPDSLYGYAPEQIRLCRGDLLHAAGFRGAGLTIAVTDAGFRNVDRIPSMQNIRLAGTKNWMCPGEDVYTQDAHGTAVLSCMAMNCPGLMTGTAPDADYWLLRTEDNASEQPVEQDYWAAAVELADSVGVDLVNTSLSYHAFDDSTQNYTHRDLDGRTSLISRQASHLADKGIVLVCGAGNSGNDAWRKIGVPADAPDVLTVGAVDEEGELADFSSIGNTADGRIKPDVVAMGVDVVVMRPDGNLDTVKGTSFAAPLLCGMAACLWQACPTLTARELMELVRQSSNRAKRPNKRYGYGLPDMWKAYQRYQSTR